LEISQQSTLDCWCYVLIKKTVKIQKSNTVQLLPSHPAPTLSPVSLKNNKCTKHLLTATFKDLHIENSKKLQKVILPTSITLNVHQCAGYKIC